MDVNPVCQDYEVERQATPRFTVRRSCGTELPATASSMSSRQRRARQGLAADERHLAVRHDSTPPCRGHANPERRHRFDNRHKGGIHSATREVVQFEDRGTPGQLSAAKRAPRQGPQDAAEPAQADVHRNRDRHR